MSVSLAMLLIFWLNVCLLDSVCGSDVEFENTAASVFAKRCIECHNAVDFSGDLDLTRGNNASTGGASGTAFIPGDSANSLLIARLVEGDMPPAKNGRSQRLSDSEINAVRVWIDSGADWPADRILDLYDRSNEVRAGRDWWSFQPIKKSPVNLHSLINDPPANPIDAFVLDALHNKGMSLSPPSDKRVLLRRVYFDLIGIPPTMEEIDAFQNDCSENAFERRVDYLLSLPQFGERWARHWLDVVRYADTNGYERDAEKPGAWRYRDWVVSALNNDMPYDRFLTEQLAGDELPDRTESSVIATGFIRLGTWDDEPNDPAEYQYDRLEDLVHATSTAFLGLTVKCARCHDHKFDPIYQNDYYRIAAAFWPGPLAHRDRSLNGGPTKEELGFEVLGWTDIIKHPPPLHSLKKGDIHRPIEKVDAGPLTAIPQLFQPFLPAKDDCQTTQRRLQLANWMTHPDHPLTSRVIVNRLWQHHFGEGLVRTPDNFGFNGQRPSHPELLDWLANELMQGQWKLKRIHKLIVTSKTYRQASLHPQQAEFAANDSSNYFLWHTNRLRLDAESVRDAILCTSGQFDTRIGGQSFHAPISSEALEGLSLKENGYQASAGREINRRSLYMFNKRGLMVPMMTAFDQCDSTTPSGRRDTTTVATQALAMLNNEWIQEQSRAFADRVIHSSDDDSTRIENAWRIALGRSPRATECEAANSFLHHKQLRFPKIADHSEVSPTEQTLEELDWISLCHVLLNTNEFIYLD